MGNKEFIEAFKEYKSERMISHSELLDILQEVLESTMRKKLGLIRKKGEEEQPEDNFDVIVNPDTGDIEIWVYLEVVPDGEEYDPNRQIPLSEARQIEPDAEVGEEISKEIKITDLGRRNIMRIKQLFDAKLSEYENKQVYDFFKDRVGELYTADVNHVRRNAVYLIDDEGHELIMPKEEQIPQDNFRKDDTVKGVIKSVDIVNNKPLVILSRTDNRFLEKLFEQEIPEIADSLITINRIARIPGVKAKVAVSTYDDRIDPVGACVGIKGSRIHGIVRELRNENIDVINYTDNTELFIQRALAPAKVVKIYLFETEEEDKEGNIVKKKEADVYVKPDDISKAIGKNGVNVNLASMLTGWDINIKRFEENAEEDIELSEFEDEIDPYIIEAFQKIGLDYAKSVLEHDVDYLVKKTGLERKTIEEVMDILRKEFY
ncbi:MAG: transcription termination/antitermination protein NusA [Chlorobi bacterium]|nr:transcription termination/antitermination protein NusA [Chlorobiota bacterium]